MERLTDRNNDGNYFYPKCFKKCDGLGASRKCDNCEVTTSICEKLGKYEDLEEQGLLLRLPCGIGSDIYFIPSKVNFRLNLLSGLTEENRVFHQVVDRITFRKNGWYMECDADLEYGIGRILRDENYGVTWFLSKEEAEAKLKELRGGENESSN